MAALQFDRGRPFPSQLLAFPRESPDVTVVERDAAKLGQPCAAVAGRPSKNSLPLRGRGTPLRANSFQTGRAKKSECSLEFSPSLGALVSSPGAADPRAGSGSQFPAVLRVMSKFKFTFSSSMVRSLERRGAQEPTLPLSGRHRRAARPPSRQRLPPNRQPTYATRIHSPAAGPAAPPAVARARHTTLR